MYSQQGTVRSAIHMYSCIYKVPIKSKHQHSTSQPLNGSTVRIRTDLECSKELSKNKATIEILMSEYSRVELKISRNIEFEENMKAKREKKKILRGSFSLTYLHTCVHTYVGLLDCTALK